MSLSVQELAKVDFPFVIVVHPDGKLSIGKPPSGEALETGNGSDVYQGQSDLLSIESGGTARDIGLSQNFQAPAETEPHSQSTESLRLLNRQKIIFFLTWSGSILITLITAILFFLSRGHLELHGAYAFFLGKHRHRTHVALIFGALIIELVGFVSAFYEMNRALSLVLVTDVFLLVLSTTIMTPIFISVQIVAFLTGVEFSYSLSRVNSLQPPASLVFNLSKFMYVCIVRMACCCRRNGRNQGIGQEIGRDETQHTRVWIAEVV